MKNKILTLIVLLSSHIVWGHTMKRYFVTGCKEGIGFELARQIAAGGDYVLATGLDINEKSALKRIQKEFPNNMELFQLDVTKQEDFAKLSKKLSESDLKFDVVINNAAVQLESKTSEDFFSAGPNGAEQVLLTNLLGPYRVLHTLEPYLTSNAMVVQMTSKHASHTLLDSWKFPAYRSSKAGVNMLMQTYAIRFPERLIIAISPGWVSSAMGGASAPTSPEQAAGKLLKTFHSIPNTMSGSFLDIEGNKTEW